MLSAENEHSEDATTPETSTLQGRLIIDRIVIENFKSYAGRQEIGPFHKVHRSRDITILM